MSIAYYYSKCKIANPFTFGIAVPILVEMKSNIFMILLVFGIVSFVSAQEGEALPRGFRSLELGTGMEAVREALKKDPYFLYEGDPDVSLLPSPEQSIIECEGFQFIREASFQFHKEILFTIIIRLNRDELDYFTMYTSLTEKYGPPKRLDPEQVIWENESVRFSLERPLSVKYIDLETFNSLREEAGLEESYRAATRKEFIEMF